MKARIVMVMPLVIILTTLFIGLITIITSPWGLVWLGTTVVLLFACLRNIPATPPHVGIVTIWGQRKPIIKKEGWRLLAPFFPFLYSAVLINVEKKNKDFHPKDVRTSERAELEIEISITWTPDKDSPKDLIEYINTGGKTGVENILDDIIEEATRQFATTKNWQQCLESREELASLVIKRLTGQPEDQPVDDKLKISLRRGNGMVTISQLGIILNRFNVGTISVKGKLGEAAEKIAVEEREREAEKVELEHVRDRAKELKELGLSVKDAIELIQTERGKVKKDIREFKGLEGIGEGVGKAVSEVFKKRLGG